MHMHAAELVQQQQHNEDGTCQTTAAAYGLLPFLTDTREVGRIWVWNLLLLLLLLRTLSLYEPPGHKLLTLWPVDAVRSSNLSLLR